MNRLWTWFASWLAQQHGLIDWIIAHAKRHPYFDIIVNNELYMARFWLVKERSWLPFAIRLHEWHRPDDGRDLHDHPCDFRSIILRGWYIEEDVYGAINVRSAGETYAVRREHFHTVLGLAKSRVTYSIFIYWGKRHTWGFLVNNRKTPWSDYVSMLDVPDDYVGKNRD